MTSGARTQIDPDAAMLLSEAADHLNMTTAETLYEASAILAPALNEHTEKLFHAAMQLPDLMERLPGLIEQLDERISELRRLQGDW